MERQKSKVRNTFDDMVKDAKKIKTAVKITKVVGKHLLKKNKPKEGK